MEQVQQELSSVQCHLTASAAAVAKLEGELEQMQQQCIMQADQVGAQQQQPHLSGQLSLHCAAICCNPLIPTTGDNFKQAKSKHSISSKGPGYHPGRAGSRSGSAACMA